VTVEYGGSDEHVILVLVLRCLSDSLALMVTDAKGRITFANSQLAQLLGYNARTLTDGMNMSALLPPPYAHIHGSFMKVRGGGGQWVSCSLLVWGTIMVLSTAVLHVPTLLSRCDSKL
jgi:PAS domain-containing protein